MPEPFNEFKGLLKAGIGDRTYKDFAKAAGISPEWITRTLNNKKIPQPSRNTLEKIAPYMTGGITLDMLLGACGYKDTTRASSASGERLRLSIAERIVKNADDIEEGLAATIQLKQFWEESREFFHYFNMLFAVENLSHTILDTKAYFGARVKEAEQCMLVNLHWEDSSCQCSTYAVIYYVCTERGKLFFFGYSLNMADIREAGFKLPDNAVVMRSEKGVPFVSLCEHKTAHPLKGCVDEALRTMLDCDTYCNTICGFGFQFDESLSPETFLDFIKVPKHQTTFCTSSTQKQLFEKITISEDPFAVVSSHGDKETGLSGYLAIIAHIMRKETGVNFLCFTGDSSLGENYDHILVEVNEIHIHKDILSGICREYAKELGLKHFGYYYHTVQRTKEYKEIFDV